MGCLVQTIEDHMPRLVKDATIAWTGLDGHSSHGEISEPEYRPNLDSAVGVGRRGRGDEHKVHGTRFTKSIMRWAIIHRVNVSLPRKAASVSVQLWIASVLSVANCVY